MLFFHVHVCTCINHSLVTGHARLIMDRSHIPAHACAQFRNRVTFRAAGRLSCGRVSPNSAYQRTPYKVNESVEQDGFPRPNRRAVRHCQGGILRQGSLALLLPHLGRLRGDRVRIAPLHAGPPALPSPRPTVHVESYTGSVQYHGLPGGGAASRGPANDRRLGAQRVRGPDDLGTTQLVGVPVLLLQAPRIGGHLLHSAAKTEVDIPALVPSRHSLYLLLVPLCCPDTPRSVVRHVQLLCALHHVLLLCSASLGACEASDMGQHDHHCTPTTANGVWSVREHLYLQEDELWLLVL